MRAWSVPIRLSQVVNPLLVGLVAAASARGLLWATANLEGKWLIAIVVALFLPWVAVLARDLELFLLALFVFLLPINPDVNISVPWLGRKVALSACDLLLAGLYVTWMIRLIGARAQDRRVEVVPSISLPFGLLVLWSALATLQRGPATGPPLALYQVFLFLKAWLAFLYLANNVNQESRLLGVGIFLCLGILAEGVLAFAQYFLGSTLGLGVLGEARHSLVFEEIGSSELMRVGGTRVHPNALASFLVPMLSIVLALWLAGRRWWTRALAALAFTVGLATLVLTFSRGGWLSFVLVAPVVVALGAWKRWGVRKACTALAGFGLLAVLVLVPLWSSISQRLFEYDYGAAWSRVPQIHVASNVIKAHPILGIGLRNYRRVMGQYDDTIERISLQTANPVHNMFLLTAAEAGLPALGFLLWLVVALFRRGWRGFRYGQGLQSLFCLGLLGSLSSYLIHGLVEYRYLQAHYLFPLLMGLLTAASLQKTGAPR